MGVMNVSNDDPKAAIIVVNQLRREVKNLVDGLLQKDSV